MEGGHSGTDDITSEHAAPQCRTGVDLFEGQRRHWGEMEQAVAPRLDLPSNSPKDGLHSVATKTHKDTGLLKW